MALGYNIIAKANCLSAVGSNIAVCVPAAGIFDFNTNMMSQRSNPQPIYPCLLLAAHTVSTRAGCEYQSRL